MVDVKSLRRWLGARQCHEEKDGIEVFPGTCEWILNRPELSKWSSRDASSPQILWVNGPPGCGKSFLYAKILQHLHQTTAKESIYFLFCGADKERVTVSALLRSWICQLVNTFSEARNHALSVQADSDNHQATTKEVSQLFESLLEFLPSCFITVDALDECTDRTEFFRLLPKIPKRFKILITSRQLPDFTVQLDRHPGLVQNHVSLEVTPQMTHEDIGRFIDYRLAEPEFDYLQGVSQCIKDRLTSSGGMFLWVRLMLQHVQDQTTTEEVMQCLSDSELPSGLSEHYDLILKRINELPKARRLLAHKVFFWMNVARRPLRAKELDGLLAVKPFAEDDGGFERARRLSGDTESLILSVCGSLVSARGANKALYPIHFTVTEYLRQYMENTDTLVEITAYYGAEELLTNDSLAAAVCLRYLSMDFIANLKDSLPESYWDAQAVLGKGSADLDPFLYAVNHCFDHLVRLNQLPSKLSRLLKMFLSDDSSIKEVFWRFYWFAGEESIESAICPGNFSGMHIATYFGLQHGLLERLVETLDPNKTDSAERTPLWWAVSRGHLAATKLLLSAGLDARKADKYSISPAHRAAACGNAEILELLVLSQQWNRTENAPRAPSFDTPINVADDVQCNTLKNMEEIRDSDGWTPLHWAASRSNFEVVKKIFFMSHSSAYGEHNSLTNMGRTPLHLAAFNGYSDIVSVLGKTTSIDQRDDHGQTPLHLAAMRGHLNIVKELVKNGADRDTRDGSNKTPSDRALENGHDDIHMFLETWSPEHRSKPDNKKMILSVMRKRRQHDEASKDDGDVPEQQKEQHKLDGQDSSPLLALENQQLQTLMLLSNKGRRLPWRVKNRTVLHYAAALGDVRILRVSLRGARGEVSRVNERDPKGQTALHYAAAEGFTSIVEVLFEVKVSAAIKDDNGLTAYDVARNGEHWETAQLIARLGRIPTDHIANDFGFTNIHCAARDGTLSSDQLEPGKSGLPDLDRFGRSPWYRAIEQGNIDTATILETHHSMLVEEIMEVAATFACQDEKCYKLVARMVSELPPLCLDQAGKETKAHAGQFLRHASKRDDVDIILSLHAAGVDIDYRQTADREDGPALVEALKENSFKAARVLIDLGADVNNMGRFGPSALYLATCKQSTEIVQQLLDNGAHINPTRDRQSIPNPIFAALKGEGRPYSQEDDLEKRKKIFNKLFDHGADITSGTIEKDSVVWLVMKQAWRNISSCNGTKSMDTESPPASFLVSKGFESLVQPITSDGLNPIHLATQNGDIGAVKREIEKGVPADWRAFSYPCLRPLQMAIENDDYEMVKLLLDHGAELDDPDGSCTSEGSKVNKKVWLDIKSEKVRSLLRTVYMERQR